MGVAKNAKQSSTKSRVKKRESSAAFSRQSKRLMAAKGAISHRYYAYMPNKKHHRILVWVLFLTVSVAIAIQMLYPLDWTLPFARDRGRMVGMRERNIVAAEFQKQFEGASVAVRSGTQTETRMLTQLGADIDTENMVTRLSEYPFWQRLIPFSILMKWPEVKTMTVEFSGITSSKYIEEIAAMLSYEPQDASVAIKDGVVVVGRAAPGNQVASKAVRGALMTARYREGVTTIEVPSVSVEPRQRDVDVESARQAAERAMARDITIRIEGREGDITPDAVTRAQWLAITTSPDAPSALTVNTDALHAYIAELNDKVRIAPGVNTVHTVDGVEQSQSGGRTGMALDVDEVVRHVQEALLGERDRIVTATLQPVDPTVQVDRQYSHTQAGLQAYVDHVTSTQNIRIVVEQLTGNKWQAAGREHESIPSASTYKLYVMLRVFDDINAGNISWSTPMLDTTAGGCFERTIVPSTNPCAEAWIRQYGRDTLTQYIRDKGFSEGTGFIFRDATHTTASDLAKYLKGLHDGTLVSGSNRDILLEKMGRQLYRTGIPAGTKGWAQDKVGFLWDYIHDAAIVHHPQGDYILVLMTKGYGTYSYMAHVTRQLESIMYP